MDSKLVFFRIKQYIKYRLRAKDEHGIHSPFLFNLYQELMQVEKENKDFYFAENFREELLNADESIRRGDKIIKMGDEVESSAMNARALQLIYKLMRKYKPETVIELGTNAGLSSLYMALALKGQAKNEIYTIEQNDDLHDKAVFTNGMLAHSFVGLPLVNYIHGSFEDKLPGILEKIDKLDFLLIDGDHNGESLLRYFNTCLPKSYDKSIFVLDDIYWSEDMLNAWNKIIEHPNVTLSIDMFDMGIVFFDSRLTKEHFTLKWTKNKEVEQLE